MICVVLYFGVFAARFDVDIEALDPAPSSHVGVGLTKKLSPVIDSTVEISEMDKVERIGFKSPVELGVVDLEDTVWWYEGGLNSRDISANYFGGRILISHIANTVRMIYIARGLSSIHSPYPSASTDVEDFLT